MKARIQNPQKKHKELIKNACTNVMRLEAEINYTYFIFKSGRKEVMSYTISQYDSLFSEEFIRINRSCMVNKRFIKSINPLDHSLTMKDGIKKKISRRRWSMISKVFVNHS